MALVNARVLEFAVVGVAIPKGSTRSFVVTGKDGKARTATTNANPKTKGWQSLIATAAMLALREPKHAGCRFEQGPVTLAAVFYLPRPKALLTKRLAPVDVPHVKKPDLDKLVRNCKDALTGVVWTDDAQVTDVIARKRYCASTEVPRAVIRVRAAVAEGGLYGRS